MPDGLDWQAFCARAFPRLRRHDFRAIKAYEAYGNADDGRNARRQALECAESDAENEGMPPKPEAMSGRLLVSQGPRA